MSLSSALSTALSGLAASTSLISIASNNISNAQTPGYTTKTETLESVDYGSTPGGVTVAGYTRVSDQVLTDNYNSATTSAAYYNTQNGYMTQVQAILGASNNNPPLSNDIAQFASAWSQYSADPESSVEQQSLIEAGTTLANDINTVTGAVGTLNTQVQSDIGNDISGLNTALKKVATLNSQIASATTSGQSTGDLQDQLDTAVNAVAGYTNVTVQSRANGQIALYTPTGQPLVDQGSAGQYTYSGGKILDANGNDVTSSLAGGSLQAAIDFVSTSASAASSTTPGVGVISKIQSQLSTLVGAFTGASSSFATAFSAATTASTASGGTQNGDNVAASFFTVSAGSGGAPDPATFAVNSALTSGTSDLPETGTEAVANSFNSTTNYTASGLSTSSSTYADLGSAILTGFQQIASSVSGQQTSTASLATYYKTQLANTTGVDLDTQLANLTMYQSSYAASAHVISTINTMMTDLLNAITTS